MDKPPDETLTPDYFTAVYAANNDPWDFTNSAYEAQKYAATLAALPCETYQRALEIGCSIGVLTNKLAARCGSLLALDVAETALAQARRRCAAWGNRVEFRQMYVPQEFPDGSFDLIVVSEVGYYFSVGDWRTAINKIVAALNPGGHIVLVHWTPLVADYPQTGDEVHDSFAAATHDVLTCVVSQRTPRYRLEVFAGN